MPEGTIDQEYETSPCWRAQQAKGYGKKQVQAKSTSEIMPEGTIDQEYETFQHEP